MTSDDRQAIAQGLWRAVRLLVPAKSHGTLDELHAGLEAVYNAHADIRVTEAYDDGRRAMLATVNAEREDAFRAGMIAVRKRSDYRDLDDIKDPEELRRTH